LPLLGLIARRSAVDVDDPVGEQAGVPHMCRILFSATGGSVVSASAHGACHASTAAERPAQVTHDLGKPFLVFPWELHHGRAARNVFTDRVKVVTENCCGLPIRPKNDLFHMMSLLPTV
jgi:hypothetical protein